ncbi:MAG TPA: tRNA (adenosine(37)-N6)-threonylcarbamoyltransferase complex dimerization subunit type 1 TsaB [Gemmatimonadales bacterium]|jgi:tRNA threonylcarbamoyl adenosine modification protein YeaZ
MITVAIDSATDRCTVAATDGERTAHCMVDGARQHARAVLGLLASVLDELDVEPTDVARLVTADGPGSFTGLRVTAAVAKALSWRRNVAWSVAPSLLARAWPQMVLAPGGTVVALSDALRGELYAGAWRIMAGTIERVGPTPRAMVPSGLSQFGSVAMVIGSVPATLADGVALATGCVAVTGEAALPDARSLLALADVPGGVVLVADSATWEPDYGRPAEAQAVWERTFGVALPIAPGIAR